MADVVRRATFVLDFATGDVKLKAGDLDPIKASLAAILKLQQNITTAMSQQTNAAASNAQANQKATQAAKAGYADVARGAQSAAEGVLLLTRAFALFGAEEEGLAAVAAEVAKIQGAIDLLQGSRKVIEGMGAAFTSLAALTNPVVAGIAAVGAVVAIGIAAWKAYEEATSGAARALGELQAAEQHYQDFKSQTEGSRDSKRRDKALENKLIQGGVDSSVAKAVIAQNRVDLAEQRGFLLSQDPNATPEGIEGAFSAVDDLRTQAVQSKRGVLSGLQSDVSSAQREVLLANEADKDDPFNSSTSPREAAAEKKYAETLDRLNKVSALLEQTAIKAKDVFDVYGDKQESQENAALGGGI